MARMGNFLPQAIQQNLITLQQQATLQQHHLNTINNQNNNNHIIEVLSFLAQHYRQNFQICQALLVDRFAQVKTEMFQFTVEKLRKLPKKNVENWFSVAYARWAMEQPAWSTVSVAVEPNFAAATEFRLNFPSIKVIFEVFLQNSRIFWKFDFQAHIVQYE